MSSSPNKVTSSRLIVGAKAATVERLVWGRPPGTEPPLPETAPEPPPEEVKKHEKDEPLCRDEQHLHVLMQQQARIHQLERDLENRPKQAYQQGYAEGQVAGNQQAVSRVDPVLAKLAASILDLTQVRKRYMADAEEDAVKLALAIARRVLHREVSVDPDSLLGVVKATVGRVDSRDVYRIRLNPEDVPALERHLKALNLPPRVELAPDAGLERGGVIVETSRGAFDASVSSQLAEIERGLVDLVRRGN
ncbi:MAG: hypothetical protein JSU00_10160 [Acidobacteria bacterium]|nr:hypothetical protein [Acidobacteriota bacterium]